ncbi:MAG: NADH-quinone oxidoreductase subunit N [Planctomycetes bacterium]|nr:NADH-quinone oxidoreductase subunit N [Planctomycetota bacterium]
MIPVPVGLMIPEIVLGVGACAALVAELTCSAKRRVAQVGALACLLALGVVVGQALGGLGGHATGSLTVDAVTLAARIGVLVATFLLLVAAPSSQELNHREEGEYHLSLLGLGLGGLVFAGAADLLTLYLGLEFLSLTGYALAGFRPHDRHAGEAGLKYVLFGALASALTLVGMSYLYGLSGSLDLAVIGETLSYHGASRALAAAALLALVGVAFKLTIAPFHLYSPDVYQGAPTISAAAFAVIPKIAAAAVAAHLLLWWAPASGHASAAIAIAGVVTMTVGNLTALGQTNAKRILALSGVAHAGYLMLALAVWPQAGALGAVGFYLLAYLAMNLGAFVAVMLLENRTRSSDLDRLAGSWRQQPLESASLALCLVSLAGIPPLAGFTAKWVLLRSVVEGGLAGDGRGWLLAAAVALLVNAVLSAFPYIRILRACLVEGGDDAAAAGGGRSSPALAVLAVCAAATLVLGVAWPVVALLRGYLG